MQINLYRILVFLTTLAGVFVARTKADAQLVGGRELVRASLVTAANSIQPGSKFRVGILYLIEPGWHLYWKNPGDAGTPPKINWKLPAGFQVGDIAWPLPGRDKEAGDLEVFVYSNELLLQAEVQAPNILPAAPIELQATTDWLVCKNICVPGHADVSSTVQVAAPLPSIFAGLFEHYAGLVPGPVPSQYRLVFTRAGKALKLTVDGIGRQVPLDFYPLPPSAAILEHASTAGNVVTVPIDTETKPLQALDGILVVGAGSQRHGFQVTSAALSPAQPAGSTQPIHSVSILALLQAGLFGFVGGLILNVMPCVLPVISLKVLGFVQEAGEEPRRIFRLSLAFASGIVACFAALACLVVLLRAGGAEIGWGFQFQDFRFVVFIATLVFVFALNLFGVFEFTVSAGATRGLANLSQGRGYGAAFFQGVFATVLATPCTAPFLGTAAAFAFAQPAWVTFLIFLSVALGMSSPYLLLAVNPGWIRRLPRPGAWMERVKQAFGFLLLGTLLWLLWIAGQLGGVSGLIKLNAVLLLVAILAWVKGAFWTPLASWRVRMIAAGAMILLIAGSFAGYSFLTTPSGLVWSRFSPEALNQALASGHPVFVDFTADWCLTCKSNERFAIDTAPVRELFKKQRVITLKADWTHNDPAITEALRDHGRAGVPMYLYYPGGTNRAPVVLPELITSQTVLNLFKESGPA